MIHATDRHESGIRVLVMDQDAASAEHLATFLSAHHYEVSTCAELEGARVAMSSRRPHVLVVTTNEHPHEELEALRKMCPRLPLVVVTDEVGQELLLDVEAFAPAVPASPSRGLVHIEAAVEAAAVFA